MALRQRPADRVADEHERAGELAQRRAERLDRRVPRAGEGVATEPGQRERGDREALAEPGGEARELVRSGTGDEGRQADQRRRAGADRERHEPRRGRLAGQRRAQLRALDEQRHRVQQPSAFVRGLDQGGERAAGPGRRRLCRPRPSCAYTCCAIAAGVGWSKTSVAGERQPGRRVEPVAQLDRAERVEAERRPCARRRRLRRASRSPARRPRACAPRAARPLALVLGDARQPLAPGRDRRSSRSRRAGARTSPRSSAGTARRGPAAAAPPGPGARHDQRLAGRQRGVEEREPLLRRHREQAEPRRGAQKRSAPSRSGAAAMPVVGSHRPQAIEVAGSPAGGGAARARRGTRWRRRSCPGRRRRAAARPRRRARTAERRLTRELVQVLAASTFGAQHAVDLLRGERVDRAVVEHAGRVHHGGQRGSPGSSTAASASRSVTSQAATSARAPRSVRVGDELARAVGVRAAAARAAAGRCDAVSAHEVAGDERAEAARAAGDEHGAGVAE